MNVSLCDPTGSSLVVDDGVLLLGIDFGHLPRHVSSPGVFLTAQVLGK